MCNRKRLQKLIGKQKEYTATIGNTSKTNKNICLTEIKHEGKSVAHHAWVLPYELAKIDQGDSIIFIAKACTYKDKYDVRKIGLSNITYVRRYDKDTHQEAHEAYKHIHNRKS